MSVLPRLCLLGRQTHYFYVNSAIYREFVCDDTPHIPTHISLLLLKWLLVPIYLVEPSKHKNLYWTNGQNPYSMGDLSLHNQHMDLSSMNPTIRNILFSFCKLASGFWVCFYHNALYALFYDILYIDPTVRRTYLYFY